MHCGTRSLNHMVKNSINITNVSFKEADINQIYDSTIYELVHLKKLTFFKYTIVPHMSLLPTFAFMVYDASTVRVPRLFPPPFSNVAWNQHVI